MPDLALPDSHPLAKKTAVEIADLHQLPLVTIRGDIEPRFGQDLNRLFGVARVKPQFFQEATTQAEALELVSEGSVGALTMPSARYPEREGVVFRPFVDELLTAETALAHLGENRSAILTSLKGFCWRRSVLSILMNQPKVAERGRWLSFEYAASAGSLPARTLKQASHSSCVDSSWSSIE